jgi:hypothetical protein
VAVSVLSDAFDARRACAGAFVALGAKLALTER